VNLYNLSYNGVWANISAVSRRCELCCGASCQQIHNKSSQRSLSHFVAKCNWQSTCLPVLRKESSSVHGSNMTSRDGTRLFSLSTLFHILSWDRTTFSQNSCTVITLHKSTAKLIVSYADVIDNWITETNFDVVGFSDDSAPSHRAKHTHNHFTALLDSVKDYLGEPAPER